MGIFSADASANSRHGSATLENTWWDHATDHGEHVAMIVSMPYKETKTGKQIVPVESVIVLSDMSDGKAPPTQGSIRTFLRNLTASGQRGKINGQDFKSLVTAAAGVPLAEELAFEAIQRLAELTNEDVPSGLGQSTKSAILIGQRDALIETLMEQWTEGMGLEGAGRLYKVSVYPKVRERDGAVFTNFRFFPLREDEREMLREIAAAGPQGIALGNNTVNIPADIAETAGLL
jgi:hypothetical protein